MSVAASAETRFPPFGSRLVKLAVSLPASSQVRFSPCVFDREVLFRRDNLDGWFAVKPFRLTRPALRHLLSNASPGLNSRLLHLEAWGQVCVGDASTGTLSGKLLRHAHVNPA